MTVVGAAARTGRPTTVIPLEISNPLLISDVNVRVNAVHGNVGDLKISLRAPNGQTVVLFDHHGGGGNNLLRTTFDDEAAVALGSASAPFRGTFTPDGSLAAFDGSNAQGVWRLIIEDNGSAATGRITMWAMTIAGNVPDGVPLTPSLPDLQVLALPVTVTSAWEPIQEAAAQLVVGTYDPSFPAIDYSTAPPDLIAAYEFGVEFIAAALAGDWDWFEDNDIAI
jgi:subtilisin-like proprotein convertase family protein